MAKANSNGAEAAGKHGPSPAHRHGQSPWRIWTGLGGIRRRCGVWVDPTVCALLHGRYRIVPYRMYCMYCTVGTVCAPTGLGGIRTWRIVLYVQ